MKNKILAFFLSLLLPISINCSAQGWDWAVGNITLNGSSEGGPICLDHKGNIYGLNVVFNSGTSGMVSSTYGAYTVPDSGNFFQAVIYSISPTGQFRWAIGSEGGNIFSYMLGIDDAFNIYLLGTCPVGGIRLGGKSCPTTTQGFIAKIDSSGNVRWLRNISDNLFANNFFVTPKGEIFVGGEINSAPFTFGSITISSVNYGDIFIGKMDSSGNPLWGYSFGGDSDDYVKSIIVTKNYDIYLEGGSYSRTIVMGTDTLRNPGNRGRNFEFITQLNPSLSPQWGRSIIYDSLKGAAKYITFDSSNNIYCTGWYSGFFTTGSDSLPVSTSSNKMFLFKYDSAGNLKWIHTDNDSLIHNGTCLNSDKFGNIWMCGQGGPNTSNSIDPMYIFQYNTGGILLDSIFLTSGGDDDSWITSDNNGYLYVAGDYYRINPFVIGNDTLPYLTSPYTEMLFVGKYKYVTIPSNVRTISSLENDISIYPNPACNICTIHSEYIFLQGDKVELYDITGRFINFYPLSGNNPVISINDIASGSYLCKIYTDAGVTTKKLVILK